MGWTALLKDQALPEGQQTDAIDQIEKDISRLQRVANRFSNIGSRPQLIATPLEPVVVGMVDYMRRRIPQHGKRVELSATVEAGLQAPVNTELFEWVIENLIKNALDAIEAAQGAIRIHAYRHADQVYIDIEDDGKGIDRRQWRNIFRPGYSTKKRGWGLGLSLAKRIVEDYHGGALQLHQSRPNEGSTFRIVLPPA
jgi:signal transduction histidine kinase